MDILTHIVSGAVVSGVAVAFARPKKLPARRFYTAGILGGAFPDVDAFSLWNRFDATVGKWLGLVHSGNEIYYGKFWYSHHAFFHSIAAIVIMGFFLLCLAFLYHRVRWQQTDSWDLFFNTYILVYLTFALGGLAHLACDLLTPASVWGGVQMFWPYAGYVGGWGKIWWWNNYDIFLIISAGALLNLVLISIAEHLYFRARLLTLVITLFVLAGVWLQASTRHTNYAYSGHTRQYQLLEKKSKVEQQRILSPRLYNIMEKVDNQLMFNF